MNEGCDFVVLSALPEELAPLATAVVPSPARLRAGSLRRELTLYAGRVSQKQLLLGVCGVGLRRAEAAMVTLESRVPGVPVLFLGVAGGLSPRLAVGDLVLGETVMMAGHEPVRSCAASLASDLGRDGPEVARSGVIVSTSNVATTLEEKRRLWRLTGEAEVAVVDMESHAIARAAQDQGRPWLVVRAVSDSAQDVLPSFLSRCRQPDGAIDRRRVALAAATRPSSWSTLLRMKRQVDLCAARLAAFSLHFLTRAGIDSAESAS